MVATVKPRCLREERANSSDDFTHSSVPLSERRDPVTMGLLWVTMVTGFPTVLAGFAWFKDGLSLTQVITYALISCGVMLLYSIPACLLGAKTGLTYALLSRKVFGSWGSRLVSFNLVWIALCWYGLTAVFLAEGLKGIYNFSVPTGILAAGLAILMAFNNFFGFSGVANFARYAAGPILILWVGYTFIKASIGCPAAVWSEPGHVTSAHALTMISSFIIGYASWGNEADYWRFGKAKTSGIAIPLTVALSIGQILFPVTGWMMARITGVTEYAAATHLMDQYAFCGVSLIAATVLVVCYFAVNDSCLYGAINSLENIKVMSRKKVVFFLAIIGALAAYVLAGVTKNFEEVASLSCIFLPSATVIILAEHFIQTCIYKRAQELTHVPAFEELPIVRWNAVIAMTLGCIVGVCTAGIIPGLEAANVGVPALQAWIVCGLSYFALEAVAVFRRVKAASLGAYSP